MKLNRGLTANRRIDYSAFKEPGPDEYYFLHGESKVPKNPFPDGI